MEEEKGVANKEEYDRIIPRIKYYMRSKNIARIFKEKCPLFAVGGREERINLFSNSLEHMGYFTGHKKWIQSLCRISNIILASGSDDTTIKIWNIEDRSIMSTLSGHAWGVFVLCNVKEGIFVSGSYDKSLIIWSKSPESSTYSHRQTLTGHKSWIQGIIRLNNREIVSGEYQGDLMIWDIDQGLCLRQIPHVDYWGGNLTQMKQHIGGDVVVGYWAQVKVWRAANNWGNTPIKQFGVCIGHAIEFLSGDLLLRGGERCELEFIDYGEIGCELPPTIEGLHSDCYINAIQRIAKNIVVIAFSDGYLKVIHPISRICYMKFKAGGKLEAQAYFY